MRARLVDPQRQDPRRDAGRWTAADAGESSADAHAELFAAVFRDAPDGIVVVDGDSGCVIEANHAVRHHLGYEPRWLIGRPFAALSAGDAWRAPVAERARLHGALVEDQELRRIDGSRCAMQVRAALASWRGRPVIIVTLRDVRERQRAEDACRRAEERYRNIFDNTMEGIFQTTPDGRYLAANRALARIYGYGSPEELMARLTDIAGQLYVDPRRRYEFRRQLELHDVVQRFESEVYRRDGTVTWISENARAVRDASGALLYYEGTVIDVSTRRQAELAQRSEAEVSGALARVGQEIIASLDSPRMVERLCQLSAELLACGGSSAWQWQADGDVFAPIATVRRGGGPVAGGAAPIPGAMLAPLVARLARSEVVALDASMAAELPPALAPPTRRGAALCIAIRAGGIGAGVLLVCHRRQPRPFTNAHMRIARGIAHLAALALAHARLLDELARANRIKSEFVATMSHELRTPLNIILGYNELLVDRHFGGLTVEQADVLARIGRSGRELLELINATLDLSRLETGRLPVDIDIVDLAALTRQIEDEARELVRDKPALHLDLALADALPVLHTDAAKLKVVVKNLLNNAIKFTERGQVRLTALRRGDGIEITVSDTGIGIAPDALPIIFEAFRQADSSMTRRYGGVGLGLHVVQRLVTLLGGSVAVSSSLGSGSTFRVWLPLRR